MKKIISCLIVMTMLVSMVGVFGVSAASTVTMIDILKVPTDIEIKKVMLLQMHGRIHIPKCCHRQAEQLIQMLI